MLRFWISALLWSIASSAAESADWLLTAGHVVTMDKQRQVIAGGAVAVRGSRILAVGPRAEVERAYSAGRRIDMPDAILTPGLINTHTHAPMVLMRGIADDLRLQEWLERFIFPAESKNVTADFVRWGTRLACMEMLLSGTTTFVDMYYFEEVIAEATKECGMRGVLGQTIIQFPVPDAKTPSEALKRAEAFLQKFAKDELIVPAVAPHAVYTNSDQTLQASRALADRYGAPVLIHVSETRKENDDLQVKRQLTPVQLLDKLGVLKGRTIAAHGVHIDAKDIAVLKQYGTGVAHCPGSNMMLASGIAPVPEYLAADVAVGLGTDGPAGSNNDLNLFEEMDLAAKLHKVSKNDPTAIRAVDAFEMATVRGARALGLEGEIGSLEPGKRADMVFIRNSGPHAIPMYDVYSHLVYALKASDVRHVMVNGRVVVRDRSVLTLKAAEVSAKADQYKAAIQKSLKAAN
ncbi:MAG TPA: amidohydrolase [Bryobacteraceae bacterium]|nr:amidohydrolase [Bryobacteraceae bacterium]